MNKNLFVLSRLPNIADLLRNAISKRLNVHLNDTKFKDLNVIEVKLKNVPENCDGKLEVTVDDLKQLNDAEIAIIDVDLLSSVLRFIDNPSEHSELRLKSIRWIQNTWAGVDSFFKDNDLVEIIKKNDLTVTRFSGSYFGHAMFDYVFAQIVNHERHFLYFHTLTKIDKQWNDYKTYQPIYSNYRKTNELTAVVLGGTGAIGSYVCDKLASLGMTIYAYGRNTRSDSWIDQFCKNTGVVKYSTKLDDLLPYVDYVISILPSTNATDNLLGNGVLQLCKSKKPVLINIGRGNVISEQSIIEALDKRWISYAVLDVFQVEPLPCHSLLWSRDDVLVTPHIAANTLPRDVVELFLDNYANYVDKKALNYTIDFDAGY